MSKTSCNKQDVPTTKSTWGWKGVQGDGKVYLIRIMGGKYVGDGKE